MAHERHAGEEAASTDCPMAEADGDACPMHRDQTSHHSEHASHGDRDKPSDSDCSMRGTCNGPMAAMFAFLSNHGILTDAVVIATEQHRGPVPALTRESLASRLASPDPPPPRL
jgi:hypothetical protein